MHCDLMTIPITLQGDPGGGLLNCLRLLGMSLCVPVFHVFCVHGVC